MNIIDEFFEGPIDPEIEAEVNTQVAVIDYCIAFAEWLRRNLYFPCNWEGDGWYKQEKDDYSEMQTSVQLFHKFLDDYENQENG